MNSETQHHDMHGNALSIGQLVRCHDDENSMSIGRVEQIGWGPWLGIIMVSFADGMIPFGRLDLEAIEPTIFEHRESTLFSTGGAA